MITATIDAPANSASLKSLIETATPGQLPDAFSGRVCEVQLQAGEDSTDVNIVYKGGLSSAGNASGFNLLGATGDATMASSRIVFRAPTGNQISLGDIYLMGSGEVRVTAFAL